MKLYHSLVFGLVCLLASASPPASGEDCSKVAAKLTLQLQNLKHQLKLVPASFDDGTPNRLHSQLVQEMAQTEERIAAARAGECAPSNVPIDEVLAEITRLKKAVANLRAEIRALKEEMRILKTKVRD